MLLEFRVKEERDFAPTCHTLKTRLLKKTKDANSDLILRWQTAVERHLAR
jgi:hypothetical protein